jgi:hypothetical protein
MPVSASGENAARASMPTRTSSSQSMSSGVKVTSPASAADEASMSSPIRRLRSRARAGSSRKRLARRVRPLTIGYGPKFIPVRRTVAGLRVSPSNTPSSM